MKYRSRAEIITMILEAARSGATKTKIMYKAYLSYSQLVEYITFVQEKELLVHEEGTQLYRLTEKGIKYLGMSNDLNDMMVVSNSKYSWNN